jgi:hypothetical protein
LSARFPRKWRYLIFVFLSGILGWDKSLASGVIHTEESGFSDNIAFVGIPDNTNGAEFHFIGGIGEVSSKTSENI